MRQFIAKANNIALREAFSFFARTTPCDSQRGRGVCIQTHGYNNRPIRITCG